MRGPNDTVAPRPAAAACRRAPGIAAALATAFLSVFLFAGCRTGKLSAGSVPFPAANPVFIDESGRKLAGLPGSDEPFRLVLLDFPWCPPCSDAWKAIREASGGVPAGTVRVYRILFDRERQIRSGGIAEVAPFRPSPAPDAGTFPVTTVLALTEPFRKEFSPEQAPVLLLTDREGKVIRKWTGAGPSFSASIVSEIGRLSNAVKK